MSNVSVAKVQEINELIQKAEIENAKNSGLIENIKKEWKEKWGTDNPDELKKKLEEFNNELNKSKERLNKVYSELINAQNWDELEEELE